MAEKYYKVAESQLVAIADALRLQKGSDKKYTLDAIPKVIKAMLVLPSGFAESTVGSVIANGRAIGVIPTVYYGSASAVGSITTNSSAVGTVTE